jgi:hypothetical protein
MVIKAKEKDDFQPSITEVFGSPTRTPWKSTANPTDPDDNDPTAQEQEIRANKAGLLSTLHSIIKLGVKHWQLKITGDWTMCETPISNPPKEPPPPHPPDATEVVGSPTGTPWKSTANPTKPNDNDPTAQEHEIRANKSGLLTLRSINQQGIKHWKPKIRTRDWWTMCKTPISQPPKELPPPHPPDSTVAISEPPKNCPQHTRPRIPTMTKASRAPAPTSKNSKNSNLSTPSTTHSTPPEEPPT